ncbi:MAG: hypothetical protein GY929_03675 [Actinomycetia bacterium]|nr:hypothetical protein [Actinomycetes bacterium]
MSMGSVVYTDGACSGNPGPGGWAWAQPHGAWANGADPDTTNQRMELLAALEAVRAIEGPLEVVSDSTYVVNCFRDRWYEGWLRRNWLNSQKKPVANRDLWEPFIDLVLERGDVEFRWVKGHSGEPMNELVDQLAVEARDSQSGRSGPDSNQALAGGTSGSSPVVEATRGALDLARHGVVVLGHQPPEIGGYDDNPWAERIGGRLFEIIDAKHQIDVDLVVVSGLRLGAEQLGARAALKAGVPLVAVLPHPDPDSQWPAASRRRFAELIDRADEVVTLEKNRPRSREQAGSSLSRRDGWLGANVGEAILVRRSDDGKLGRLASRFDEKMGVGLWVIDPLELAP